MVPTVRTPGFVNTRAPLLIYPPSEVLSRRPVGIDLNVLCDLAERLTGLFIMAHGFNSRRNALHDVTMPRSWFINLILPDKRLEKDTSTLPIFVGTIIELMLRVDGKIQPGEKFTADGNRLTNFTGPLYIARM